MPDPLRLNLDRSFAALRRLDSGELVAVIHDDVHEVFLEIPGGADREVAMALNVLSHRLGIASGKIP